MSPRAVFLAIHRALIFVFGRWQWEAPPWLSRAGAQVARGKRAVAANPLPAGLLALALLAAAGGYTWHVTRPKPHYVTYVVTAPGLTEYNDSGIASIKPLTITFNESAAPLKQIKTVVTSGITLSPAVAGAWFWTSDKELRFSPKSDWPVDAGQFESHVSLRVRATTRDRQPQIAFVDLLPGGGEPVLELQAPANSSEPGVDPAMQRQGGASASLPVGVPGKSDWAPSHVDVREDRLIIYGDARKDAWTFVYRVRANNAGTYQVPPAFAEGMYNRTIVGLSRGATLEVVKP